MERKATLYEAERDGTNKLWEFKPQPYERLKWLLDYLINVETPESYREGRVTALLSGEVICTNFSVFKLVREEERCRD